MDYLYLNHDKEDAVKQYKWVDVTGECEVNTFHGTGLCVRVCHHGDPIGLLDNGTERLRRGYRWRWMECGNAIRIERRVEVEKPAFVFTYTPEFVKNLDCKNMSDESVLHHCVLKWNEVIAAHEAGVDDISPGDYDCPACRKFLTRYGNPGIGNGCSGCPLTTGSRCCGNTYDAYSDNPSATTARAVRDYIQTRLDAIRKPKPWVPQVGDRVRSQGGTVGEIVYIHPALACHQHPIVVINTSRSGMSAYCFRAEELRLIEAAPK